MIFFSPCVGSFPATSQCTVYMHCAIYTWNKWRLFDATQLLTLILKSLDAAAEEQRIREVI